MRMPTDVGADARGAAPPLSPPEQELSGSALLVLANKQDMEGAMTAMEISQSLKLHALKTQSWQIQACSALTGGAADPKSSSDRPGAPPLLPSRSRATILFHSCTQVLG